MADGGPPAARCRRRIALRIGLALVLVLGVVATTGAAVYLGLAGGLSVRTLEETILSWGPWGVFASIGLMVLHSFVPFPAELLALANGMVYGPLWGVVVTWTGAMLGAFAAFGLARALGRPFVERMVARRHWDLLDEWTAVRGWRLLLIGRLIPVIAFNLINYAAGLTRISWWTFAWATGVGILPMTALMVLAGDQLEALGWEMVLLALAGALILWLAVRGRLRPEPPAEREGPSERERGAAAHVDPPTVPTTAPPSPPPPRREERHEFDAAEARAGPAPPGPPRRR